MYNTINSLLEPDNRENRKALRQLFQQQVFQPQFDLSLAEQRQLALKRLQTICTPPGKYISVHDFLHNPLNIFAVHEMAGLVDGSMATKMTVQFNLFGGTLLALGTDRHARVIEQVDSLKAIGCFALTELGYGNNAVEMETTADYDAEKECIIVNTPRPIAQKYWITNGAVHAQYAIVFAQLRVNGVQEGVHAILVPIRDPTTMATLKGVTIEDMGWKQECNGVDNGKLSFDKVVVPVQNLLNKYSDIVNKQYKTTIKGTKRDRFLAVADRLLSGRLCIASMSLGLTKLVLTVALKYSLSRKTVGSDGKSSASIISYQLQQAAILPLLARTVILNIGLSHAKTEWAKGSSEALRLCCVIKPLVTWHAENTSTVCRERCGGQGYLAINCFGAAIGFAHAGITAEGDNVPFIIHYILTIIVGGAHAKSGKRIIDSQL